MTIGIASYGPDAGAAVITALLGAELLGRGAIGGFAVFAIMDGDGELHYRTTQEGGLSALLLPKGWRGAQIAAAISSGPHRPEPLVQFLPGRTGVGLVTGHRLPNSIGPSGKALNAAVLDALEPLPHPQPAIDVALDSCPEIDAGLIVVTKDRRIGWGNSRRVARRDDLGTAGHTGPDRGFALLHNSIFVSQGPCQTLADALAGLVRESIGGPRADHFLIELRQPVAFQRADRDRIVIDEEGAVIALESANDTLLSAERIGTAGYLGAPIWQAGKPAGVAATDLFARMSQGVAHPLEAMTQRHMIGRRAHVPA